jgi:hypothetical protein
VEPREKAAFVDLRITKKFLGDSLETGRRDVLVRRILERDVGDELKAIEPAFLK